MAWLWIVRFALVLGLLIVYWRRPTRAWAIALLTGALMVTLDALRARALLSDVGFFGWLLGGGVAAGAASALWLLLWPTGAPAGAPASPAAPPIAGSAPPADGIPTGTAAGIDRRLLFLQMRDNLGADDLADLIFDLGLSENEIVHPARRMPEVILAIIDKAEAQNQLGALALGVERILTPLPADSLPRLARLSADTPPGLLRLVVIANHDLAALQALATALDVDWEELGSDGKKSRVRRLLWHLQRRGRLMRLVDLLRQSETPDAVG